MQGVWVHVLKPFHLVQSLIHGELEQIDEDYIGTICGSYRRGLSYSKTVLLIMFS